MVVSRRFWTMVRPAMLALVVGLAVTQAGVGQVSGVRQVCISPNPLYRLAGDALAWNGVSAVSSNDSLLAVLTDSDPVIHLFRLSGGTHRGSWGGLGEGPGEFRDPAGIALAGDGIYALDEALGRLSIFEFTGDLVRTVALHQFGMLPNFPRRLYRAEGDTLLFLATEPTANSSAVIALSFGDSGIVGPDTVVAYRTAPDLLRLTAPGAPSWTVPPPYSSRPRLTPVSGGVAFWQGPDPEVRILGVDGAMESAVSLSLDGRFEVTGEDRESWLASAIPSEFMGRQGVFEPIREEARRTVSFPEYHPLVFRLLGGPDGFLWVLRTPAGREQVWDVVDSSGRHEGRLTLAAHHSLMSVLPDRLVLRSTDDLGVESVQVHQFLPCPP